jgi:uncharacterized protein (DUF1697 family)
MTDINVLLLRGVNVGGANRLPMPEFRQYLTELGLGHVQTHIQSGNVVFSGAVPDMAATITAGMKLRFGFAPRLFFYALPKFTAILDANPFAAMGAAQGDSVHIHFLSAPLDAGEAGALTALAAKDEALKITDAAAYLFAPSGIGRSALAARLGLLQRVDITARTYTSVMAIAALARTIPA